MFIIYNKIISSITTYIYISNKNPFEIIKHKKKQQTSINDIIKRSSSFQMIKSSLKRNSEKFVQRITGSGVGGVGGGSTQVAYQSVNDEDKLSNNHEDDDDDELNDENECYSVNKMN